MDTSSDREVLAGTGWGEARGEGPKGIQAVMNCVMNRVALAAEHRHFGDGSVRSACLAPWQFDCWLPGDPNRPRLEALTGADANFAMCLTMADQAIAGQLEDLTDGCTYYYAVGTKKPKWAMTDDGGDIEPHFVLGHHLFFKDIA